MKKQWGSESGAGLQGFLWDAEGFKMTLEELFERDGRLVYTFEGISMMPLLRQQSDAVVIERKQHSYKILDVVLYIRADFTGRGKYVLHRILRENEDGTYWIVGDNCTSGETVRKEQILGVMTAIVRDGKMIDRSSLLVQLYRNTWCRCYYLRFMILGMKCLPRKMYRFLFSQSRSKS